MERATPASPRNEKLPMTSYNVHFGHRDDCVVWAPASDNRDVSVLQRDRHGRWHCALCRATICAHIEAAEQAGQALPEAGVACRR